ncbi:MAG: STAS domain-containing protein [Curvibacter sp.]|nr:MAG: STAS domain-containing protein [Curvibacter sp.]
MTKEDPSGLLSKVVRFVTSPTTNWGDLNQPEEDRDSAYNKQALKEMIERKRRNDFVRRREFDQLRKLRKREALNPPVDPARPSFFQSSLASRIEDRAGTLKKIDEIEAQMSMQWWRAKQGQPPPGAAAAVSPNAFAPTRPLGMESAAAPLAADGAPAPSPSVAPAARKPKVAPSDAMPLSMPSSTVSTSMLRNLTTQPGSLLPGAMSVATRWDATQPATHFPAFAPTAVQPHGSAGPIDFSATQPVLPESLVFVHQPELEEAAIRYANGDFEAAESALLELLRQPALIRREPLWMALFDLYRSTGQQDRFDSSAIDFAGIFGKSGPLWGHWSDEAGRSRQHSFDAADQAPGFQWIAPPVLNTTVLSALQVALERAPSPWLLDWTRLSRIEPEAVEPLADMVGDWAGSRVRLRWQGMAVLDDLLRDQTPSGQAEVPQGWWRLRMESLRLLGRAEEFELVALDYCVTYELSPPSWQAPYCECLLVSGDGSALEAQHQVGMGAPATASRFQTEFASTALVGEMSQMDSGMGAPSPISVALTGEVTTDVEGTLPVPLPGYQIPRVLVVDCSRLVRIDFLAAGSVLNWAAARQSEGTQVQFQHLNRLVAVFFNVIGINEHARVIPRQD